MKAWKLNINMRRQGGDFLARVTDFYCVFTYKQESPPALTRKRHTDRGVASPRVGGGVCTYPSGGGTYYGGGVPTLVGGTYPGGGVPTLVGGYLLWCGGYLLWWGGPTLVGGVPTLGGGTPPPRRWVPPLHPDLGR